MLTPIAPAHAYVIRPGALKYTDLFLWPNWREILGKYDCTVELSFYLWNAPSASPPVVITPPPIFDPAVTGSSGSSSDGAVDPPDPIGAPGGDGPGGAPTVPEPSTWAVLLLGFAGLGYAGFRRSKRTMSDKRLNAPA
jgi:PEP-CTERM motif